MTDIRYWTQLATEQFPPSSIVAQAKAAERAGFEAVNVSDHFQPWWEGGESGHAATDELTPPHGRGTAPRAWSRARLAWGTSALSG